MPRFDFQSPGAAATDAIREFFAEREELRRQAELERLRQLEESRLSSQGERGLDIRQKEAEARVAETIRAARQQDVTNDRLQRQFEAGRADVAVEEAGADTRLPEGEVGEFIRTYRPERVVERPDTLEARTVDLPATDTTPAILGRQLPVIEGGEFLRPGARYEEQRQRAEEREALVKIQAAERARLEAIRREDRQAEAAANRELRAAIAGTTAGIAQQRADLATNAAQQKADEAEAAKEAARASMESTGSRMMGLASELIDPGAIVMPEGRDIASLTDEEIQGLDEATLGAIVKPTLAATVGSIEGIAGVGAAIAGLTGNRGMRESGKAAIDSLASLLAVGQLQDLKAQSRTGATGFGALSEPELAIIENAASKLRASTLSDTEYAREVLRIYAAAARSRNLAASEAPEAQNPFGASTPPNPFRQQR